MIVQEVDNHNINVEVSAVPSKDETAVLTDGEDNGNKDTSVLAWLRAYITSPNDGGLELFICVVLGCICLGIGYSIEEPQERPIPVQVINTTQDETLYIRDGQYNQVFEGDTVPDLYVYLMILVTPLVQLACCVVNQRFYSSQHNVRDWHKTICVYILTLATNDLATWALKAYAGYLRPSFYQICQPNASYDTCLSGEDYYRDSFPSGHASFSFCTMVLLYKYLERTFGYTSILQPLASSRPKYPIVLYRVSSTLSMALPLGLASFVSVSRVVDNRHHPADIVAGAILGSFLAHFFFSLFFTAHTQAQQQ